MSADRTKILVVCGPTACGKTAAGIALAKHFCGEIVSADSMQIYRTLDVGTAKPTAAERADAPHHLIDVLDPEAPYSVADFLRDAALAIDDIAKRGRLPIIVGGTGLYISALIKGTVFSRGGRDEAVHERLSERERSEGLCALYEELARVDPTTAERIHRNDRKRILRALEYFYSAGEPISAQLARSHEHPSPYSSTVIYLDYTRRAELYAAVEARVGDMLERGLLNEARRVFEHRARYTTAAQAIGYKEFFGYFSGEQSLSAAVELLKKNTRNYAKRQISWFSRVERDFFLKSENNPLINKEKSEIFDEISARLC